MYANASRDSLRSSDVALSQSGALSLVRAFVAICQKHSSPELTESVAEAVAAMSRFPALHQGLIMEGDALSLLAPLCLEDFGIQRQEASLGMCGFSTQVCCTFAQLCAAGTLALLCSFSGSIECSVTTALQVMLPPAPRRFIIDCCLQCMFEFAVANPAANEAVMNACVALAAVNAEASIAVATSVIMEHIGELWRCDPSSPASAAGAKICQTASNMVPSACDALVQAGFSAAASSAACLATDPECYLKLLIAFAADDGCVELMIGQSLFMQHLSGTQTCTMSPPENASYFDIFNHPQNSRIVPTAPCWRRYCRD